MLGFRPGIKVFNHTVVDIEFNSGQVCQWALWDNPKCAQLPRVEDYDILKLFLNSGDFAIDVGAHVGDTTLPMALCVGKKGLVLALEPNPATYRILEENSKLNQELINIVPINKAAMQTDGDYVFQYNEPSLMNGGYQKGISLFKHASFFKINVKGVNLSKLLVEKYADRLRDLKFIKTDLEGGDYTAFLTMIDVIKACQPIIQSEINGVMPSVDRNSYISNLKDLDYQVLALDGVSLNRLKILTQGMVDSGETFDILAIPKDKFDELKDSLILG